MPLFNSQSVTRGLLTSEIDTKNFKIDKAGRFGARFFQILVAAGAWFFLGAVPSSIKDGMGLSSIIQFHTFLSIASPFVSAAMILIYFLPWFKKSWTSIKTLMVECLFDTTTFVLWTILFSVEIGTTNSNGGCPPGGKDGGCDKLNWVLAWSAFSMLFWFAGLCFDIWAYLKGAHAWGDSLSDGEADSVLRRLGKITSRR